MVSGVKSKLGYNQINLLFPIPGNFKEQDLFYSLNQSIKKEPAFPEFNFERGDISFSYNFGESEALVLVTTYKQKRHKIELRRKPRNIPKVLQDDLEKCTDQIRKLYKLSLEGNYVLSVIWEKINSGYKLLYTFPNKLFGNSDRSSEEFSFVSIYNEIMKQKEAETTDERMQELIGFIDNGKIIKQEPETKFDQALVFSFGETLKQAFDTHLEFYEKSKQVFP